MRSCCATRCETLQGAPIDSDVRAVGPAALGERRGGAAGLEGLGGVVEEAAVVHVGEEVLHVGRLQPHVEVELEGGGGGGEYQARALGRPAHLGARARRDVRQETNRFRTR